MPGINGVPIRDLHGLASNDLWLAGPGRQCDAKRSDVERRMTLGSRYLDGSASTSTMKYDMFE